MFTKEQFIEVTFALARYESSYGQYLKIEAGHFFWEDMDTGKLTSIDRENLYSQIASEQSRPVVEKELSRLTEELTVDQLALLAEKLNGSIS